MPETPRYWVGTYPSAGAGTPAGRGEGIWRVHLDADGRPADAALAAVTPAPSFLARHPALPVLYAASETSPEGRLTAWAIQAAGSLRPLGSVASGGADPCHILVHPAGLALYATNYSSGTVATVRLADDGTFDPLGAEPGRPAAVHRHQGRGVDPVRQDGPHAHSSWLSPSGRWLLVADLGTDELRRYRVDPASVLHPDGVSVRLPSGTGPRHLVTGPGEHLYVVGELDVTLHVLDWHEASGTATSVQVLPACRTPLRSGHRILPAHVALLGSRLYLSVRGADVIAAFDLADDGSLTASGELDSAGTWPRHFLVEADRLIVANQTGGGVAVLAPPRPPDTGGEGPLDIGGEGPPAAPAPGMPVVLGRLDVPSPSCVIADRPA